MDPNDARMLELLERIERRLASMLEQLETLNDSMKKEAPLFVPYEASSSVPPESPEDREDG